MAIPRHPATKLHHVVLAMGCFNLKGSSRAFSEATTGPSWHLLRRYDWIPRESLRFGQLAPKLWRLGADPTICFSSPDEPLVVERPSNVAAPGGCRRPNVGGWSRNEKNQECIASIAEITRRSSDCGELRRQLRFVSIKQLTQFPGPSVAGQSGQNQSRIRQNLRKRTSMDK